MFIPASYEEPVLVFPFVQLHIGSVETGISEGAYPVAQVDVTAGITQLKINGVVAMPEDEIIKMLLPEHFFGINDQPFVVFTEEMLVGRTRLLTAFTAEIIGQPYAPGRVQLSE